MSERIGFFENSRNRKRVLGAIATVIAVGAAIKYGPELYENIIDFTSDESLIVAGVPGQIETYDRERSRVGTVWTQTYWLGIEQCPADVEAAKRGEATHSYDKRLGVRNAECNFDWVEVGAGTFGSVALGEAITFEGEVGEPLRK